MHHEGRVYPSDEELVIFCEVAGNKHRPLTIEAWNDGLARGALEWKRNYNDGVECGYSIVRLLRSLMIQDGERNAGYH